MNTGDPLLGYQLGNFRIQQALGRGGMARVYKGLDLTLKRPVAIKVIEEGLRATATYAQRFEREAQAVANLKHPNIVTIFQFGKHDTLYYLVMEYIDGVDLDAILRNYEKAGELMPHTDVTRILDAMASALDYAHRQGVIHRDVKPSNIMLERDGRPVLTDFGLALRVSEGTVGDTFGSPHYISPEQARNSANAVPQSDLYSLAVVAYELLTGVVPFDDPAPTALAMQHIMAAVPSPRAFNRNLSEQVEQVLFRALAKTPEERYPTGAEFSAALRQAVEAMKQHPVKVITADLPPLPPGVTPPNPRRLSMQTAVDKLNQELALAQAKGQSRTRRHSEMDEEDARQRRRSPSWLSYVVAIVGAFIALGIVGVLLTNVLASPAVPTSTPSETSAPVATPTIVEATQVAAAPTTPVLTIPSATPVLSSPTVMPTVVSPTPVPPSATHTPLSVPTTIQPSPIPASPTTVPPTTTPTVRPTLAPATATKQVIVAPTVLYPDGNLITLIWDEDAFYLANKSSQRLAVSNIAFERILKNGSVANRFSGGRWAAYYPYNESRKCMILEVPGKGARYLRDDCPNGQNAEIYGTRAELFWTANDNSVQFRVLWRNKEVGRCTIASQRCDVRLPSP